VRNAGCSLKQRVVPVGVEPQHVVQGSSAVEPRQHGVVHFLTFVQQSQGDGAGGNLGGPVKA
jgi:hypothetical protein